jgi:excisionase family DNA binding protein
VSVHRIEPLWTVDDVAEFLGVPVNTLYQWRYRRTGPRASRVGRHLRYDPADVRAWFNERAA